MPKIEPLAEFLLVLQRQQAVQGSDARHEQATWLVRSTKLALLAARENGVERALLTLSELEEWLILQNCGIYLRTPHSETQVRPVWQH